MFWNKIYSHICFLTIDSLFYEKPINKLLWKHIKINNKPKSNIYTISHSISRMACQRTKLLLAASTSCVDIAIHGVQLIDSNNSFSDLCFIQLFLFFYNSIWPSLGSPFFCERCKIEMETLAMCETPAQRS